MGCVVEGRRGDTTLRINRLYLNLLLMFSPCSSYSSTEKRRTLQQGRDKTTTQEHILYLMQK